MKHLILIKVRTADPAWLLNYISVYKSGPWKIKNGISSWKDLSPHVVLSLTFWLNSHLERGGSSNLLIMPGLLRSDWEALVSPLLQENGRTPVAYIGDANSLSLGFIRFPRKPSYSASFLHWIFLLSYPYLTTLYIFNSIISWSPTPSPLRIPWILWGWTPAYSKYVIKCSFLWDDSILL